MASRFQTKANLEIGTRKLLVCGLNMDVCLSLSGSSIVAFSQFAKSYPCLSGVNERGGIDSTTIPITLCNERGGKEIMIAETLIFLILRELLSRS